MGSTHRIIGLVGPATFHGDGKLNRVAITFDDGPWAQTTPQLLDLLKRRDVTATFFVVGDRVDAEPLLLKRILDEGHSVGNHTQTHDVLLALRSQGRVQAEIKGCMATLARHGVTTGHFRPPVGILNPIISKVLMEQGLRCILFSCRAVDFGNLFTKKIASRILRRVSPGDIILLHDRPVRNRDSIQGWLDQVEEVLNGLVRKKLDIVRLDALLEANGHDVT